MAVEEVVNNLLKLCPELGHQHTDERERFELLVLTDSNYAVQGLTEWLPNWKVTWQPPVHFQFAVLFS